MGREKIVWSTANSVFVPYGLKTGEAMSSKIYYVTLHIAWKYTLKRQLVAGIIFLGASKHQEMKIHKIWSQYQPQKAQDHLVDIWAQEASTETHIARLQKSWHSYTGLFSGSAWLRLLHSISAAEPSLVAIYCSVWCHLYEAIWLEPHQHGTLNKNGIGCWPHTPACENRLGMRPYKQRGRSATPS